VTAFLGADEPVISVDTKKKDLVGEYANGGKEYHPKGEPTRVKTHDFVDKDLGRAVPYGIYDIGNDEGWVSVGDTADTATFAVEAIRRWWYSMGIARFPNATKLLITADGGGSNGHRVKLWKVEWPSSRPRPVSRSRSPTTHRERPSGTRSSTRCGASSR